MSENYSVVADVSVTNIQELDALINKIQSVGSAIGQVSTKAIKPSIDTSSMSGGMTSFLNSSKGDFSNVGRELGQSLTMGMQNQFGAMGGMATSVASALGPIGMIAGAGAIGLGALAASSTRAAMAWEDMKTSIGRTTGLEGANLEDLMSQLQDLRQEFGVTGQAASSMVEQAGSIGVGQKKLERGDMAGYKQEIIDFTRATAMLQGAWGMSAEATSSGIGKMGSVTLGQWNIQRKARGEEEMSWAEYAYKVGGTVDNLANAMGSSEEEVVTAMRNSSGAVAKWAPDEKSYGKWQAMASFLIDTGDSAGEAGTKIERVSQKMEQNGADVAALLGLDQTGLNTKLKSDFMGTVQELGTALAAMPASSRPDLFKMFGLEGASMIGKVVADIEAGTGKLQSAFDLALKPGNVEAGYENVADNASKQFDRIAQAAQVSLEKIGGQLLPLVTDLAGGIADAWIAANEKGTELFTDTQKAMARSDKVLVGGGSLLDAGRAILGLDEESKKQAALDEFAAIKPENYIDEWGREWTGDELKGKLQTVTKDGVSKGMTDGAKSGASVAAAEWQKAFDEKVKAGTSAEIAMFQGGGVTSSGKAITGMTEEQAIAAYSSQQTSKSLHPGATTEFSTGMDRYKATHFSGESIGQEGIWKIFDGSGKLVADKVIDLDAWKAKMKPIFMDMPKYMKSVSGDLSSELEGILSDGVVKFAEKDQLKQMVKGLDDLRVLAPVEFDAAGLDKVREKAEAAFLGVPITFDTGEAETNFALWLQEKADLYTKIATETGTVSTEPEQKRRQQFELGASERSLKLLDVIDKAVSSGDVTQIGALPEVKAEFEKLNPEVASATWYVQLMQTATKEYSDQVKPLGGTFMVLDEAGKTLGITDLRTSVASDILGGSLLRASSAADAFASRASSYSGMLSEKDFNWAQSRISDAKATSMAGSFTGKSMSETTLAKPNFQMAKAETFGNWDWFTGSMKVPKLGQVSKVSAQPGGGMAILGERGEDEWVIPVSSIRGLYSESAKVDSGTMRYFEDYPEPKITPPTSYRWSQYPAAPNVQERNQEAIQTAWLSEGQPNSRDVYSGRIQDAQLAAIGKSQVEPWFAKGEIQQPKWWSDAATKASPQYATNWQAAKGGSVPSIEADIKSSPVAVMASSDGLKVRDAWSSLYGESFTEGCIATNAPDASLKFTPSASTISEIGRKMGTDSTIAWNQLYGESFTEGCIGTNKPDDLLKFTPSASLLEEAARAQGGFGAQLLISPLGASDKSLPTLVSIEKNTAATKNSLVAVEKNIAKYPLQGFDDSRITKSVSIGASTPGALVTGLSKEGYLATYDPRTDTCEGLSFVEPNPSLKTSDPFYLGLTEKSPYMSEDKAPGYGWSNVATPVNDDLANLMKISEQQYNAQQQAAKDAEKTTKNTDVIAKNTGNTFDLMGQQYALQQQTMDMAVGALAIGGGIGGGGWGSLYGSTAGSFWGGLSISGGGGWVGTGASATGWGAQAVGGGTGGFGGGNGWGSVQWAEGGIVDSPEFFMNNGQLSVRGEAGPELILPLNDRKRSEELVRRYLPVARKFAAGGAANVTIGEDNRIGGSSVSLGGLTVHNYASTPNERELSKEVVRLVVKEFNRVQKSHR